MSINLPCLLLRVLTTAALVYAVYPVLEKDGREDLVYFNELISASSNEQVITADKQAALIKACKTMQQRSRYFSSHQDTWLSLGYTHASTTCDKLDALLSTATVTPDSLARATILRSYDD